jgi:hypothetical protein
VAEKLGRKWIATDLGKFGIHTTRKRLIGVQRELKAAEKDSAPSRCSTSGRYERQAYLNVGGRLTGPQKEQALAQKERRVPRADPARLQGHRLWRRRGRVDAKAAQDGFFHGKNGNGRLVVIGPINLPVGRLFVEEVITECRKRGASRVDVLAFEFEMGLFPAVLEEARGKGIDLAPKYIPAEVFDKRAVDKGQVVFHDISLRRGHAALRQEEQADAQPSSSPTFSVLLHPGRGRGGHRQPEGGQERGDLRRRPALQGQQEQGRHRHPRAPDQEVDRLGGLLGRGLRLREPQGDHQGARGHWAWKATLPGIEADAGRIGLAEFEERWTGGYIFENEWQSFRTRQNRDLELTTALHTYDRPGRYTVAVKVIDIFGNDTMTPEAISRTSSCPRLWRGMCWTPMGEATKSGWPRWA